MRSPLAFAVYGLPRPKGSMKCVGTKGRHRLINNDEDTQEWEDRLTAACLVRWNEAEAINGPVAVEAIITLARPASIKPKDRPWPTKTSPGHGDVDKLARPILDALVSAAVIADDAQVVELVCRKVYPDSPHTLDRLTEPGAVIRVLPIADD